MNDEQMAALMSQPDVVTDLFGNVPRHDDGGRSTSDFYETPAFMTRSLLHFHPAIVRPRIVFEQRIVGGFHSSRSPVILECCSGNDAISVVLRDEHGLTVHTNDLDPRHPAETHEDATKAAYWQRWSGGMGERLELPAIDWVITNPPFNIALPILQHAVSVAQVGVAFLLRKTFLEPTEDRGSWLNANPPTREIGEPRYSFRGAGNDSVSCDWMIWERYPDRRLGRVIDHLAETRTRRAA